MQQGAQSLSARGKAAMPPLPKEASSEEEQPAPQRRKAGRSKPSRRQGSKLIQGGGDQSSEDYDDGENLVSIYENVCPLHLTLFKISLGTSND